MVLLMTAAAGAALVLHMQRTVALVPGETGCARMASAHDRADCFGEVLLEEIDTSIAGATGTTRTAALNKTLTAVDDRAATDTALGDSCHQAMHRVGNAHGAAAARAGVAPAYPGRSTRLCTAGYTHGLVQGYLKDNAALDDLAPVFEALCHDADARAGCAHGLGHTVQSSNSTDRSIELCGALPSAHVLDCANGVYMERAMRRPAEKPASFRSACASAPTRSLRSSCLYYLPANAATNGFDDARTAALCSDLKGGGAPVCFESFGRNLGMERLGQCERPNAAHETACLRGVLQLSLGSEQVTPAAARTQCGSLEQRAASACSALVGQLA